MILKSKAMLIPVAVIGFFVILALFAPWIAPHSPYEVFDQWQGKPPFWSEGAIPGFWLGTDDVGRDLLSRLIYGARLSLMIGFFVVLISGTIGTTLGLIAGYFGGWIDKIISRLVEIRLSLPSILLAIVGVAILGQNLTNTIIAIATVSIPNFIRLTRASVILEKQKPYVLASQLFKASHLRQMFINILPNCLTPIIVQATLGLSDGILDAAALGFLGLGAQPPTPEWGVMLADARPYIETKPWLLTLPGLCILLVVLAFNLIGDQLRDHFDPKSGHRS